MRMPKRVGKRQKIADVLIGNPSFFRSDEKELAKVQRKFAKTEKGTPERRNRLNILALGRQGVRGDPVEAAAL